MAANESHYEINVAHNGKHFFATAERSCNDIFKLKAVLRQILKRFPKEEGFAVSVSYIECTGNSQSLSDLLPADEWGDHPGEDYDDEEEDE